MDNRRGEKLSVERLRRALRSVERLSGGQLAAERVGEVGQVSGLWEGQDRIQEICVQAARLVDDKGERERIGFAAFLGRQVRFVGGRIWFMQGIGIIVLLCMCKAIFREMFEKYVQNIAFFLCCLSVLVMFSAVPMVYRSVRYAMYETELVTRFSAVRLLLARLFAIGLGNFAMLGVILVFAAMRASMPAARALLYLLMPYLAASGGLLYLLKRVPVRQFQVCSVVWGCFLIGIFVVLRRLVPVFFMQTFSGAWVAVCLLLLLFCVRQFYDLVYDSAYTRIC